MIGTTALVLAGGINQGYSVLTHNRAKSALPVCGHFRIIDFVLTNLALSNVKNVGIVIQYLPASLIDHVGMGRSWDYDSTSRRLKLMPPFIGMGKTDWFQGTADAIEKNMNFVNDTKSDLVLILSADHVYSMNYEPLVEFHRRHNADLTIVTTRRPPELDPRHFGYVTVGPKGRVVRFEEKPAQPPHETISAGIYLFSARALAEQLAAMGENHSQRDLPHSVIEPMMAKNARLFSYPFHGPWHYLPDLPSYVNFHRRLLRGDPSHCFDTGQILTNLSDRDLGSRPSPYFGRFSDVRESLVSPGCVIQGTVIRSVLSPGVIVGPKAVVEDCVLFHDCEAHEGARLRGIVSDKDAVYSPYCEVISDEDGPAAPPPDAFTVVGKGACVLQGVRLRGAWEVPINQAVTRAWVEQTARAVATTA